jgi:hypothetical protein
VNRAEVRRSFLKVGGGRGFIVEVLRRRVIVTAAHCLPNLPPAHAAALPTERTYLRLVGQLKGRGRRISVECLHVNPVADIAVLGTPDIGDLDAYDDWSSARRHS